VPFGACCTNDATACYTAGGTVCCADGIQCVELINVDGVPFGVCCANEAAACLIGAVPVCCPDGQICDPENGCLDPA
jgi:hypothetical protein